MKSNAVKKPVKISITPQPETVKKYTVKDYYDLLLKLDVLLLADMLKNLEVNP